MKYPGQKVMHSRVPFELVLSQLRKHDFTVLSTVSDKGIPHSAGVNYGVSRPGQAFSIYVMTGRHLRKAVDIAENPHVSLVVPLSRRVLWFVPPATIQLSGRAEILDWTDEAGTEVFRQYWTGRIILDACRQSYRRGETRSCFLKITPNPIIYTYLVGTSSWEIRKRLELGAGKAIIPPEYRAQPASEVP